MQIYPDPVRIVSIGKKVEDLLAEPEKEEWQSYSSELCGGHISPGPTPLFSLVYFWALKWEVICIRENSVLKLI